MWFATPPLDIIDAPADTNHYDTSVPLLPRRIVIHHTGGVDSLGWLTHASTPPVSAHRLIDRQGRIFKIVDDAAIAWHVGKATLFPYAGKGLKNANWTSLGIELENLGDGNQIYTSAQLVSCARQVVEWTGKYGYLPVVGHADLDARKRDPVAFPWDKFMVLVWDRITGLADH